MTTPSIEANEERIVVTIKIPNAYLHTENEKYVIML